MREFAAEEPRRFAARVEPERDCWWFCGVFGLGVVNLAGAGGDLFATCKGRTWEWW